MSAFVCRWLGAYVHIVCVCELSDVVFEHRTLCVCVWTFKCSIWTQNIVHKTNLALKDSIAISISLHLAHNVTEGRWQNWLLCVGAVPVFIQLLHVYAALLFMQR